MDTKDADKPDEVALALRDHQAAVCDWEYRDLAGELHRWVEIFDGEFKLALPSYPVLSFARLRNAYGTYQADRGELGTRDNIAINTNELARGPAQILATLCHELVHLWQAHLGQPSRSSYHNRQFRAKAAECGLIVDKRGCHSGYTAAFTDLIERHGVSIDPLRREMEAYAVRLYGNSARPLKMQKWSCLCTRVRCATQLRAWCGRCKAAFEPGEHVIPGNTKESRQ